MTALQMRGFFAEFTLREMKTILPLRAAQGQDDKRMGSE
jgi:hypothetical protein